MVNPGIFANLAFSVPFGVFMIILFTFFRSVYPVFYHRNALCNGKPVLGIKVNNTFFAWFKELISLKDDFVLRIAGLDALLTSNGFRLMVLIACIMAIPCLFILAPYYYFNSDRSKSVDFNTFTISDIYTDIFWPPLLVLVLLTFLIIYAVYSFYANFLPLRQAFLLRPSALSSTSGILSKAEAFGSVKYARRRIDSATCTVLLHPVPSYLGKTPQQIKESLEKSGLSSLESVQIVGNYGDLKEIMEKRDSSLEKLESALKTVCEKLSKKQKGKDSDDSNAVEEEDQMMPVKERSDLLIKLINDVSFCSDIRPRHKTSKPAKNDPEPKDSEGTVDSLRHFYKKLQEREDELQSTIKSFNNPDEESAEVPNQTETDSKDDQDFEKRYIEETTFISWKKIFSFSSNYSHASYLASSRSALLHFSDFREASKAQQWLLGSKADATASKMVAPNDLNWRALKWSERQRWYGILKSNIYYWGLVILFTPISVAIVTFIDTKSLGTWIPIIAKFHQNHPQARAIVESVLAPFLAIMLMQWSTIWVYQIIRLRGNMSRSELLLKCQSAHTFFMFFQVVVVGAIFSNLYQLYASSLTSNGQESLIAHLRENIPKKAHYFFNITIQDIFNDTTLELLSPKSLFNDRGFLYNISRKDKSTRELIEYDTEPPELEIAFVWSRFIMFPYFIFMTFIIVSPLNVITSLAYFLYAYYVFRYRFTQYGRDPIETGGLFWRQCSQQIIYGLIVAQLSVLLQYTQFKKGYAPSVIIVILIIISLSFIGFLKRHFSHSCDYLTALEDQVNDSKSIVKGIVQEQSEMISHAVESLETSEIIKSNLDSQLQDYLRFSDIDPKNELSSQIILNTQDLNQSNSSPESSIQKLEEEAPKPIYDPYWSIIPLNLSETTEELSTFDRFQVDALVDSGYVKNQYEHPLILEHSQVVIVPKDLPKLLKSELN